MHLRVKKYWKIQTTHTMPFFVVQSSLTVSGQEAFGKAARKQNNSF